MVTYTIILNKGQHDFSINVGVKYLHIEKCLCDLNILSHLSSLLSMHVVNKLVLRQREYMAPHTFSRSYLTHNAVSWNWTKCILDLIHA